MRFKDVFKRGVSAAAQPSTTVIPILIFMLIVFIYILRSDLSMGGWT
jgi:hypothetical protein